MFFGLIITKVATTIIVFVYQGGLISQQGFRADVPLLHVS
jgi:hypothetical protein